MSSTPASPSCSKTHACFKDLNIHSYFNILLLYCRLLSTAMVKKMRLTSEQTRNLMLGFIWVDYLWLVYLDIRQFCKQRKTTSVPAELASVISKKTLDRARTFSVAKLRVDIVISTFSITLNTAILLWKLLPMTWGWVEFITPNKSELPVSCLWVFLITVGYSILQLPFTMYCAFRIINHYTSQKITVKRFLKEQLFGFVMNAILELSFTALVVALYEDIEDWTFLTIWLACALFTIIVVAAFPNALAKMFVHYDTLPNGELKQEIENLAASLNFPLSDVYIGHDVSNTSRGNAFFFGVCGRKCIVVYDSLLPLEDGRGFQVDEVIAILTHEIGHWKYHHGVRGMIIVQVNLFAICFSLFYFIHEPRIYEAVGFSPRVQPLIAGFIVIMQFVLAPYFSLSAFISNAIGRYHENQADAFCKKLQRGEALKRGLVKLYKDNMVFPVDDALYSCWHYDHPTLLERLRRLDQ